MERIGTLTHIFAMYATQRRSATLTLLVVVVYATQHGCSADLITTPAPGPGESYTGVGYRGQGDTAPWGRGWVKGAGGRSWGSKGQGQGAGAGQILVIQSNTHTHAHKHADTHTQPPKKAAFR